MPLGLSTGAAAGDARNLISALAPSAFLLAAETAAENKTNLDLALGDDQRRGHIQDFDLRLNGIGDAELAQHGFAAGAARTDAIVANRFRVQECALERFVSTDVRLCRPGADRYSPDEVSTVHSRNAFVKINSNHAARLPARSRRASGITQPASALGQRRRDHRRCRQRSPGSDAEFCPHPAPLGGSAQWS